MPHRSHLAPEHPDPATDLLARLQPNTRDYLRMLAEGGTRQRGRGYLAVELHKHAVGGIRAADYLPLERLEAADGSATSQLLQTVREYDMATDYVVAVIEEAGGGIDSWFALLPKQSN